MKVAKKPLGNVKQLGRGDFSSFSPLTTVAQKEWRKRKKVFNLNKRCNMSRKRKFTIEFKVKAVELAKKSDRPIARTAKYLGVGSNVLGQWIKKYAELKEAALRCTKKVP